MIGAAMRSRSTKSNVLEFERKSCCAQLLEFGCFAVDQLSGRPLIPVHSHKSWCVSAPDFCAGKAQPDQRPNFGANFLRFAPIGYLTLRATAITTAQMLISSVARLDRSDMAKKRRNIPDWINTAVAAATTCASLYVLAFLVGRSTAILLGVALVFGIAIILLWPKIKGILH